VQKAKHRRAVECGGASRERWHKAQRARGVADIIQAGELTVGAKYRPGLLLCGVHFLEGDAKHRRAVECGDASREKWRKAQRARGAADVIQAGEQTVGAKYRPGLLLWGVHF
jgi:hypothetical protein